MMKLCSFILALAVAQGVLSVTPDNDECNADNCARAVTGTRSGKLPDETSRIADCSSFMLITVTPATSTITKTTTVLTTTTLTPVKKREAAAIEQRQVTVQPSSVPTYASACSGTVRYSSACSCWGITAKTTTAPTPLTTTTKTVTATITVTACPTGETKCGSTCQDLLNDPKNCGTCGNVCVSGVCQNGVCSAATCNGSQCASLNNCGVNCFCFETSSGAGFCGPGTSCAPLPDCISNADCAKGTVCATGTCCGRNVCLGPQGCENGVGISARSALFGRSVGDLWTNGMGP